MAHNVPATPQHEEMIDRLCQKKEKKKKENSKQSISLSAKSHLHTLQPKSNPNAFQWFGTFSVIKTIIIKIKCG